MDQHEAQDISEASTQNGDPASTLGVGTKICVRNRFLGDWTTGFKVAEVLGDGYRIRRLLDDHVFPDVFRVRRCPSGAAPATAEADNRVVP